MKLKSFGCSFVFGTDLPHDSSMCPISTPSHLTYPALIARHHGWNYSCHARPGAGNFEILARITDQLAGEQDCVYVINWTWIDRFSYIDDLKATHGHHSYNPRGWQSIMPGDTTDLARVYYKDLHSQLRDKFESLTAIKAAVDNLQQQKISFIMTWTDRLLWETEFHCPPMIGWLQNQIRPHVMSFDGVNFVEWSRQQAFPISDTMHPLEQAHQAAADLILDRWDQYLCHSA